MDMGALKVHDGLGVAYAIGERLKREIAGKKEGEEAKRIMDKYSHLIGMAIERHSFNITKGKSKSQMR